MIHKVLTRDGVRGASGNASTGTVRKLHRAARPGDVRGVQSKERTPLPREKQARVPNKEEDLPDVGCLCPFTKTMTRDPVCGMEIETARAEHSTQYGSGTFYFCSKDCYRKFKERPQYFAEIVKMEKRYVA